MNSSYQKFRGFVIDPKHETLLFNYQHLILAISSPLNLLVFYLIQTKTPQRSNTFKYLLLHLHFWVTTNDVFNMLLYAPVPLFPIITGYCEGILCKMGVSNHQCMNGMHINFTNIDFSLMISYVYRHQALLDSSHILKLTKKRAIVFVCCLWFSLQSCYFYRFFTVNESFESEKLLEDYPDMAWLLEKTGWGYHNMQDPDEYDWIVVKFVAFKYSFFSPSMILGMVLHIFKILRSYIPTMSSSTKRYHRQLTIVLIVQSSCLLFTFIPIAGMTFSILTLRWSYEVNFIFFGVLLLFSTAHSISLIAMTPSYREVIERWFGIIPNGRSISIVSITTSTGYQNNQES